MIAAVCARARARSLDPDRPDAAARGARRGDAARARPARTSRPMPPSRSGCSKRSTERPVAASCASARTRSRAGLAKTAWPGRLEHLQWRGCRVLLDAAHNPAGARALASYLETFAPDGVTLVFGAMQRQGHRRDARAAGARRVRDVICTTAPSAARDACRRAGAHWRVRLGLHAEAVADPAGGADARVFGEDGRSSSPDRSS